MRADILHCFSCKRWSGDATSALNSAVTTGGIVLTEGGEKTEIRLRRGGISDVRRLNMSGMFGALNLSRMFRIVRPSVVYVHSESLIPKVHQAVALSKLTDVVVRDVSAEICLPEMITPVKRGEKLIWIGYITADCGLRILLEAMKFLPAETTLRVVGEGEAKIVGSLLNMARTPQLAGRIEWVGEQENVYDMMNGCRAGVVTAANPQSKVVYQEMIRAGLPIVCGETTEEIINGISLL